MEEALLPFVNKIENLSRAVTQQTAALAAVEQRLQQQTEKIEAAVEQRLGPKYHQKIFGGLSMEP